MSTSRGPGISIRPQPAKYATIRGAKSRIGISPAYVSGARMLMMIATAKPMKNGCMFEMPGARVVCL
jgi:hypothetical protein